MPLENAGERMTVKRLVVGALGTNCYIVGSEETSDGMIIDPGDEADRILGVIETEKLSVKLIVITHGHIDHIGALKDVKEGTGAEIAINPHDMQLLNARMTQLMSIVPAGGSFPEPDRMLNDGDVITVGDLTFTVIHTPGHSPGGICLYSDGVLFSGDTLFQQGIGRADFPGSSYPQLLNSIRSKLLVLPDDTLVLPGHGPETTIGEEKQWNPFLRGQA